MSRERIQGLLIASGLVALITVAAVEMFSVRDLLAAFLIFGAVLVALGVVILASFFIGDGIAGCFELLVTFVSLGFRHPRRSVIPHVGNRRE